MPRRRVRRTQLSLLLGLAATVGGCSGGDGGAAAPGDAGKQPPPDAAAALPEPTGASPADAARVEAHEAGPAPTPDASFGPTDAGGSVGPEAGALIEIETDQSFRDLRPEFLDYFWNNLDPARFEQWHPGAHEAFAWSTAPKLPGDLGAEPDAAYTARLTIAGAPHQLRVRYVAAQLPENRVTLEGAAAADVWLDDLGPLRFVAQYQQEKEEVRVRQRIALPATVDAAAWRSYLEERMVNLATFIREPFQQQYVEQELTRRGTSQVTTTGLDFDIVVTQDIGKVTPQMVDWWWDNMGETERYRHWHPTAHQSFVWTTPPKNSSDLVYDVGSVQKIVEIIGESSTLNITWLNPAELPIPKTYASFIYGQTNLDGTPFGGFLVHEYEALAQGGIRMKSTFRLPWLAGDVFAQALGKHCIQEMQFLQYYLPRLFAREYKP